MDLGNIRKMRKKVDMTQKELSEASGVSQSLIAKIESGRTEPSYSKAQKIFKVLESANREEAELASDIMKKNVLTLEPDQPVGKAIETMKKHGISQVPVIDNKIIGLVTESSLLEHIFDDGIENLRVKDVMLESPPTVTPDTPETAITPLLKHFPLVLVVKKGEVLGIITKYDIISKVYV